MRKYITREPGGHEELVAIKCDGCGDELDIDAYRNASGWRCFGRDDGKGTEKEEWHYCDHCLKQPHL